MSGPVRHPDNPFTRMLENTAQHNQAVRGGGVASATPLPTAQSADLGKFVPDEELPPLTLEEREALDRAALAAGIQDPRIVSDVGAPGPYNTLEAAITAGTPVVPVVPHVAERLTPTRLPDFQNIQAITLSDPAIIVDGMRFPIDENLARELRLKAIETIGQILMAQWTAARNIFTSPSTVEDANGGTREEGGLQEVQRESEGSSEESSR